MYILQDNQLFNRCISLPDCVSVNPHIAEDTIRGILKSVENYKHSLSPRIIPKWNSLPSAVVNASSLEQFTLVNDHYN